MSHSKVGECLVIHPVQEPKHESIKFSAHWKVWFSSAFLLDVQTGPWFDHRNSTRCTRYCEFWMIERDWKQILLLPKPRYAVCLFPNSSLPSPPWSPLNMQSSGIPISPAQSLPGHASVQKKPPRAWAHCLSSTLCFGQAVLLARQKANPFKESWKRCIYIINNMYIHIYIYIIILHILKTLKSSWRCSWTDTQSIIWHTASIGCHAFPAPQPLSLSREAVQKRTVKLESRAQPAVFPYLSFVSPFVTVHRNSEILVHPGASPFLEKSTSHGAPYRFRTTVKSGLAPHIPRVGLVKRSISFKSASGQLSCNGILQEASARNLTALDELLVVHRFYFASQGWPTNQPISNPAKRHCW